MKRYFLIEWCLLVFLICLIGNLYIKSNVPSNVNLKRMAQEKICYLTFDSIDNYKNPIVLLHASVVAETTVSALPGILENERKDIIPLQHGKKQKNTFMVFDDGTNKYTFTKWTINYIM